MPIDAQKLAKNDSPYQTLSDTAKLITNARRIALARPVRKGARTRQRGVGAASAGPRGLGGGR